MGLVISARGSGTENTATSFVGFFPNANCSSGSIIALAVVYDNSGSQGADPFSSVEDDLANTWTSRINQLRDPGAANAGTVLRVWTTAQNIGALTTGTAINVFFTTNVTVKVWAMWEVSSNDGGTVNYDTQGASGGAGGTITITTSSLSSGYAVIGFVGNEGNGTRTDDSDTTNGSWSTGQNGGIGSTTSGQEMITQYKILTGTGTQTYNPTVSSVTDWNIGWISLFQTGGGGGGGSTEGWDPFGMMGIFGL